MRSWAWRQWGLGALDFCGGPANTTIVHATIVAPQHDFSRSHVALSSPRVAGREGTHVRSTRREAIDGCGREGENLRPSKAHRCARSVRVRRSGQHPFRALSGSSNPEARSCQVARRRGSHWPDPLEAVVNELRSDGPAVRAHRETLCSAHTMCASERSGRGHCAAVCPIAFAS
jgi:hypothetical protein